MGIAHYFTNIHILGRIMALVVYMDDIIIIENDNSRKNT